MMIDGTVRYPNHGPDYRLVREQLRVATEALKILTYSYDDAQTKILQAKRALELIRRLAENRGY